MSLQTVTEINLDLNQPGVAIVHAKQYDTVRMVKAHLFDNNVKWLVPNSGYVAVVGFKKADRIGGFYDATEDGAASVTVDANDRSIIYILLDRNVVTTVGNVSTEVTFYDTVTRGRLSTFSFITQVDEASITELDLASNPYFNVLSEQITAVLEAADSLAGISAATPTKLAPTANPTASFTGGTGASDPYVLHLGIPQGVGVQQTTVQYAVGTENVTPSSGWQNSIADLVIPDGYLIWTKVTLKYHDNSTATFYTKAAQGYEGPSGVAVQTTEPITNVKVWIDPDETQEIAVAEINDASAGLDSTYSSSKIENDFKVISTHTVDSENEEESSYCVKFPDGTMICGKRIRRTNTAVATQTTTTFTDLLYTTANYYSFGDWPTPFINRPIVTTSVSSGDREMWCGTIKSASKTSAGEVKPFSSQRYTGITFVLYVIGIGRWK